MITCAGCGAAIPISMVDGQAYYCPATARGYIYHRDRAHEAIYNADHIVTALAVPSCPRCRRLERMLLLATGYLSPANWYESAETLNFLDRVKAHLRRRYRDMLNRYLPPSVE